MTSKPGNGAAEVRVGDEGKGGPEKTCQTNETTKVEIDGEMIEVKGQIHMIAPNEMLDNPLLSLVTQASLGGLCPLLIVTLDPILTDIRLLGVGSFFVMK